MTGIITRFYTGESPDYRGRMIDEILTWDDEKLERVHDYIQWLFPLKEPSAFNPNAPLLTSKDIEDLRSDPQAQENLLVAFQRYLQFLGFECFDNGDTIVVTRTRAFRERAAEWITVENHNFLRISRVLTSMRLLGKPRWATAFKKMLETVYKAYPHTIGEETLGYWRRA